MKTLDQDAYQFLALEHGLELKYPIPETFALCDIGQSSLSIPERSVELLRSRPTLGPNVIIVDQTIMPSSWSADDKKLDQASRETLRQVVSAIVNAFELCTSSSGFVSSSAPTTVLVHENIAKGFHQAMSDSSSGVRIFKRMQEDLSEHLKLVETAAPGELDFLPVFRIPSFDHALDFIQDDIPAGVATYIFANSRFGDYAFRALRSIPQVHVNEIPERALGELGSSFEASRIRHSDVFCLSVTSDGPVYRS